MPRPGTLPWTTPTVTEPSRPASGSTWNERSPTPATPRRDEDEHRRQHPRADARTPLADEQHDPGDDLADEGDAGS